MARPKNYYSSPTRASTRASAPSVVPILRSDVPAAGVDGSYRFETETADGVLVSGTGAPTGPGGAVESSGTVAFTFPNGEPFLLTYVATADGGFQPQSSWLPVAPKNPHPIPDFVLEQIRFAEEQDALKARKEKRGSY